VIYLKRIIGVTGGISSGKSNVCSIIKEMGFEVIDCDEISYLLSKKGYPIYDAIIKAFGNDYLLDNKEIDRKKLGRLIFNDNTKKELLNNISHPIIIDEIKRRINNSNNELIFLEAPLLYEAHIENLCDKVICVFLNEKYQVERLMARENIDKDYALAKIHSQMDLNIKKSLADYVIDSRGTFDETRLQVEKLVNEIKGV